MPTRLTVSLLTITRPEQSRASAQNAWSHHRDQGVEAMRDNNLLPYDGDVFLIEDDCAEFDWPAITRKLMDTIPWQVEIARIFGRAMPVPRLVAWFGDITYSYSGISHPAAPFPEVIGRLRRRAETLSSGAFNSLLCNLYRSGDDGVGWHSDDEPGLGGVVTLLKIGRSNSHAAATTSCHVCIAEARNARCVLADAR
jgi:hypothetical protein